MALTSLLEAGPGVFCTGKANGQKREMKHGAIGPELIRIGFWQLEEPPLISVIPDC